MLATPNRLNLAKHFRFLKKNGRAIPTAYFTVLYRFSDHREVKAGFIVSNKVGGAVVRNRLRRQLRELVYQNLTKLPASLELVLIARPFKEAVSYEKLNFEFAKVLSKLSPLLHP